MTSNNNNTTIKKYNFVDWTKMVPGAIIGGFMKTPGGLGLGSGWSEDMEFFPAWKRICISEFYTGLRDKLPTTMVSRVGVSIYHTNSLALNEILFDSKIDHFGKVNVPVTFHFGELIGLFVGNILRVDGETYVNILTLSGLDVWLIDQSF